MDSSEVEDRPSDDREPQTQHLSEEKAADMSTRLAEQEQKGYHRREQDPSHVHVELLFRFFEGNGLRYEVAYKQISQE